MMKRFLIIPALLFGLTVGFSACTEDDNPVDTDPVVSAPTNLKASSADKAIFLEWDASVDEDASNFGSYDITVFNRTTNDFEIPRNAGAGVHSIRIDGLDNGTRYVFTVRSVTELGKISSDYAEIEWSPAYRQNLDATGKVIKVYATTSTMYNSALDMYNAEGKAEVIAQSGQVFKDRGDMYVYAMNNTSPLMIKSPAEANNKGMETQFSTAAAVMTDNMDAALALDPPSDGSYTLNELTVPAGSVTAGQVFFGRLVRGDGKYYFRMQVVRTGSSLIQGSGADRYVELKISFQNTPDNPFAKQK